MKLGEWGIGNKSRNDMIFHSKLGRLGVVHIGVLVVCGMKNGADCSGIFLREIR